MKSSQNQHGEYCDSILEEFFDECIESCRSKMSLIHRENKVFQRIREDNPGTMVLEICRELMFENIKEARWLMEEIYEFRRKIKEINRV